MIQIIKGFEMLQACKDDLLDVGINPASSIEYDVNGVLHLLTIEEIIEAYLQTEKSALFLELFQASLQSSSDTEAFFQNMGELLLLSSLSQYEFSHTQ